MPTDLPEYRPRFLFVRTEDGRIAFYPYGLVGRGFWVHKSKERQKLKILFRGWDGAMLISLPFLFIISIFFGIFKPSSVFTGGIKLYTIKLYTLLFMVIWGGLLYSIISWALTKDFRPVERGAIPFAVRLSQVTYGTRWWTMLLAFLLAMPFTIVSAYMFFWERLGAGFFAFLVLAPITVMMGICLLYRLRNALD